MEGARLGKSDGLAAVGGRTKSLLSPVKKSKPSEQYYVRLPPWPFQKLEGPQVQYHNWIKCENSVKEFLVYG